ncbi:MAG: hypothetical protein ABI411_12355 [Tahibacter sp.]
MTDKIISITDRKNRETKTIDWENRGKTIRQLIEELKSFENLDLPVVISLDSGTTHRPISLVGKKDGLCVLMHGGNEAASDRAPGV